MQRLEMSLDLASYLRVIVIAHRDLVMRQLVACIRGMRLNGLESLLRWFFDYYLIGDGLVLGSF